MVHLPKALGYSYGTPDDSGYKALHVLGPPGMTYTTPFLQVYDSSSTPAARSTPGLPLGNNTESNFSRTFKRKQEFSEFIRAGVGL